MLPQLRRALSSSNLLYVDIRPLEDDFFERQKTFICPQTDEGSSAVSGNWLA